MRTTTRPVLILLLGFIVCLPLSADEGRDFFALGLEASRAGAFDDALRYFREARASGLDTPELHYNLGVTQFRLGNLEAATAAFLRASAVDSLRGPALYNLGLVALESGKTPEAVRRFREARSAARTEQIRDLARRQLARLEPEGRDPERPPRVRGWLSVGAGYDSNPLLEADELPGTSGEAGFLEAVAWGDARLTANDQPDIRLQALGTLRRYPSAGDADFAVLDMGLRWRHRQATWRVEPGVGLSVVAYDDRRAEQGVYASVEMQRDLTDGHELFGRLEAARLDGGPDYSQLDGERFQILVGIRGRDSRLSWLARYEATAEDREGLSEGDAFASRSPVRHGFLLGLDPALNEASWLSLRLGYRFSRYQDVDQRASGGSVRRVDHRWTASLALHHALPSGWEGFVRLGWTDNQSRVDVYDYTRTELMLGVDRAF